MERFPGIKGHLATADAVSIRRRVTPPSRWCPGEGRGPARAAAPVRAPPRPGPGEDGLRAGLEPALLRLGVNTPKHTARGSGGVRGIDTRVLVFINPPVANTPKHKAKGSARVHGIGAPCILGTVVSFSRPVLEKENEALTALWMDTAIARTCPLNFLKEDIFLSEIKLYRQLRPYNKETGAFPLLCRWWDALGKSELDPKYLQKSRAQADFQGPWLHLYTVPLKIPCLYCPLPPFCIRSLCCCWVLRYRVCSPVTSFLSDQF